MKKYFSLNKNINWLDILTSVKPSIYTLLDSNNDNFIFAWESESELIQQDFNSIKLDTFEVTNKAEYVFGYVGYKAKNAYFQTTVKKSKKGDNHPQSIFYVPKNILIKKNGNLLYFGTSQNFQSLNQNALNINLKKKKTNNHCTLVCETSKNEYLKNVDSIKSLIQNGDIYELNYCINFTKEQCTLDVIETFINFKNNTKAPFSSLFKYENYHIVSASPERFFNKQKNLLISQPIKGTAKRGENNKIDELSKQKLINDEKEIAENIMIVDLVRNDFSRFSDKNSVIVSELCKLYTFENVHQLISTINSSINSTHTLENILNNIFPMGSMTGAPKKNAIEFIDEFEKFQRNCYSGSLGMITPNNNMDFNVIIRSVVYNSILKNISIGVGGAITNKSIPLNEYSECLIKLQSFKNSLSFQG